MKTLNNLRHLLLVACGFGLFATTTMASGTAAPVSINQANFQKLNAADQQSVLRIVDRLQTITTMDRSNLTHEQRKALRTETKALKREATRFNQGGGGTVIYISAGTVIIILLIILILT